ncbi:MAG: DUF2096 family protein [Aigarchaeota archaeon]|nr:DUF2096 family protein [Aigarchaeota archaeon]MCX8192609.1 DUF2096 family protein [Nitrososphaeria archaeon]MDW7985655.1 DUF2096 family protein [Nitrososphaerota archaeon]
MISKDSTGRKTLSEIETKWRELAELILDLKKRDISIPERILTAFTCCKSLINHCKYHLDDKANSVEYYKILSQLSKDVMDIESSLIIIAANKLGEDYALEWTTKLGGRIQKLDNKQ